MLANPFSGKLRGVSDANIADTSWYMMADPKRVPNFIYGFLSTLHVVGWMAEQDVMRLIAEVQDKASGVLKRIQESLKATGEESEKAHEKGSKAAEKHHKNIDLPHERLNKTKEMLSEDLMPALATLGISAIGVGEGIALMAEKIKSAGEQYQVLNDTMKRGHVSSNFVQGMGDAFARLGIDASKANTFIAETGATLDKLRRGSPEELGRLNDTLHGTLPWVQNVLKGAHSYEEASERIMKALTDTNIPDDQRRTLAEALHIDPRIVSKNMEEVKEALEKSMEEIREHGLDKELLGKLDDAYTELRIKQGHFWNDLIDTFGPAAVTAIDHVTAAIERLDAFFNKAKDELHEGLYSEPPKATPEAEKKMDDLPWYDLYHYWGLQRMNPFDKPDFDERFGYWPQGKPEHEAEEHKKPEHHSSLTNPLYQNAAFTTTANDTERMLVNGVREGTVEAFRQFMGEQAARGSGGGGFTNASFNHGRRPRRLRRLLWPFGGGSGGGDRIPPDAGTGTGEYINPGNGILGPFDRSRFRKELDNNPALRNKILRIAANEQSAHPLGTQAVLESMMNRAAMRGTSLEAQARWHESEGGYYQQGNMGRGALENSRNRAVLEESLRKVLNNSNITGFATDNSSGGLAEREAASGKFIRHGKPIHGESFFHPGWAEPKFAERWHRMMDRVHEAEAARESHGARLADHIRHRNILKGAKSSGLMGGGDGGSLGHLTASIDLNGFPKGTRTKTSGTGLLKEVRLNRGRTMPVANQES